MWTCFFVSIPQFGFNLIYFLSQYLPFQYHSKSFHWTIINAVCHSGHALFHMMLFQTVVKCWACILKPSVWMEKRMCIRFWRHRLVKRIYYNGLSFWLQILIPQSCGHTDQRSYLNKFCEPLLCGIIFRLCYVCQPFLIWTVCMELLMKIVLRNMS